MHTRLFALLLLTLALIGCRAAVAPQANSAVMAATPLQRAVSMTPVEVAAPPADPTAPPATRPPTTRPAVTLIPTPIAVAAEDVCGSRLPALLPPVPPPQHTWTLPYLDPQLIPPAALPALTQLFAQPNDVSLVVYRVGYEGIGFYHNADEPMPLASLTKLITLVAYAQAVDAGTIDPARPVARDDLDRYYLPRSDLGAHALALGELGDAPLTVDTLAWMMMRHSANSAADWLHAALGQAAIEETAVALGLAPHSAPCPFLGRFLMMGGDTLPTVLAADPVRYGAQVVAETQHYADDAAYRAQVQAAWGRRRSPPVATQREFVAALETHGTAAAYAGLMARIASGQVGSPSANALIRRHLGWPLEAFPSNRDFYTAIGYKNGTMPGMLTTVYYAQPLWADTPIVVALFYRNLPQDLYRDWRRELPNDALAHWLMRDPNAVHILHVLRSAAGG